jgi:hypothetical protein
MSNATRKMMDECVRFSATLSAYVDGELDAGHAVDMESHMIACDACAERVALIKAMRASMKRTAAAERCPAALRARLHATVEHERQRAATAHGPVSSDAAPVSPKLMRLRYAVGLAAAAGVAFAMGMSRYVQPRFTVAGVGSEMPPEAAAKAEMDIDGLLDQLVALHAHPFQPETRDLDQLQRFDPYLGVRVRRPSFRPLDAAFEGARLHPVSDRGAYLQLQYGAPRGATADGKHITVYAFNPRVVPVRAARLESRMMRQHQVLVGRVRGYAIAALESSGVGYAIASDFDSDESTRMVISALEQ